MDPVDELVRLQVRLLRKELPSQAATIEELHDAGFGNQRIAELLGTTTDTVKVTIQRAKKKRSTG